MSSFTVCLPTSPTSHRTALPVNCRRMGLVRALSSGICLLSYNLPHPSLLSVPRGLSTLEMPSQPHRRAPAVPWQGVPSLSQHQGSQRQGTRDPGNPSAVVEGRQALRTRQWHPQDSSLVSASTLLPCWSQTILEDMLTDVFILTALYLFGQLSSSPFHTRMPDLEGQGFLLASSSLPFQSLPSRRRCS